MEGSQEEVTPKQHFHRLFMRKVEWVFQEEHFAQRLGVSDHGAHSLLVKG